MESDVPSPRKLPNGKNQNDKRRQLHFYQMIIMSFYYKEKIPVSMLENKFSIEHIFPNSSVWDGELDKDRSGNLIPIIHKANLSRGNKHIKEYKKDYNNFFNFITDIIPDYKTYDTIISHDKKIPNIINNDLYNQFCKKNEETYKQHFINCLFN
jgi:hypothetical protein